MIKLTDILFEGKLSKSEIKKMKDKFDKTGKLPPHLQKLADLMDKHSEIEDIVVPGLEWMADIKEGNLTEGKWSIKGKYLEKDGGTTSIPGPYDNDAVVVGIKNDTFNLYKGRHGIYAAGNKYDKSFKNEKELVKWLNKEKAKYYGIDRR